MCPSFTGAGRTTKLAWHSPKVKADACERIRPETILREAERAPNNPLCNDYLVVGVLITGAGDDCLACRDASGSRRAKEPAPATGTNSATLASTAHSAGCFCARSLFPSALSDASLQDFKILFVAPERRCQVDGRPMGGHGFHGDYLMVQLCCLLEPHG
jgi:hypothetical protein